MPTVLPVIIKDIGYEDFTQHMAIKVKMKEIPKVIMDNIIKQYILFKLHGCT